MRCGLLGGVLLLAALSAHGGEGDAASLHARIDTLTRQIEAQVIGWRRDIHAHPELGNREFRTGAQVAEHLRQLGLSVRAPVAHTGVVGVLKGGLPGPVVALRADMDALPVTEQSGLPFASKHTARWQGKEVGVAHVCGHDGHTAILMGVAQVLASLRDRVPGTVVFIFQPAEEGPPDGEEGGAALMIKEGALADPKPAAIFGLHLNSRTALGMAGVRPGPFMASGDTFRIVVDGRQTHAALPWLGVDPIVLAAQIIQGVQTIESRQVNALLEPSVISVTMIQGGNRANIIPDSVEMTGMIRALDEGMRSDIQKRLVRTAEKIAESGGGRASVAITPNYDVTVNDEGLARLATASLKATLGSGNVFENPKVTVSEDFSAYQRVIPGFFFFLGVVPPGTDPAGVFPNHSPRFWIDERVLAIGVRSLSRVALDYLVAAGAPQGLDVQRLAEPPGRLPDARADPN